MMQNRPKSVIFDTYFMKKSSNTCVYMLITLSKKYFSPRNPFLIVLERYFIGILTFESFKNVQRPKIEGPLKPKIADFSTLPSMSSPMRRGKLLKTSRNEVLESTSSPESFRRNCQGIGVLRIFFGSRSPLRSTFCTTGSKMAGFWGKIFGKSSLGFHSESIFR